MTGSNVRHTQGARAGPYPDEAADCWAAGVLAHEVLTGQPLFGPRGASRGGGELAASPSLPSFEQVRRCLVWSC